MDTRGFLTCVGLWLCSVDGMNFINYATMWLKTKGIFA